MKQKDNNVAPNNSEIDKIIKQLDETLEKSLQKARGEDLSMTSIRYKGSLSTLIKEYKESNNPEIPKVLERIDNMLKTEILNKDIPASKDNHNRLALNIHWAIDCEAAIYNSNKMKAEIVSSLKKNHFNEEGAKLSNAIDKLLNSTNNTENGATAIERLSQTQQLICGLEEGLNNLQVILNDKLTIGKSPANSEFIKNIVKLYEDHSQNMNQNTDLILEQNIASTQPNNNKFIVNGLSKQQYDTAYTNFVTEAQDFLALLNSNNNTQRYVQENFKDSLSNLLSSFNKRDESYNDRSKDIIERMYALNATHLKEATRKITASMETLKSLDNKTMGKIEYSDIINSHVKSLTKDFNEWATKDNSAMRFINNRQAGLLER